ncbi:hypothetical protein [Paraburkholderia terrae]|uniref:hypothetical protein n=1 Tax=Paraburkholderia terrae TaxID=311230 RepID=UPI002060F12A|nr:hypothetical protein [Paraburkholderia terrae]BDC46155.1 hypothetical protein PTKU15_94520 [Paraburkholderia terrae]
MGGINIDDRNIVVASAEPRFICQYGENSVVTGTRFNGFGLALGTTEPGRNRFWYYAELSPIGPFPGSEMKGYLRHYEQELDDVFLVRGIFATTVDGTSRLDITIDYV